MKKNLGRGSVMVFLCPRSASTTKEGWKHCCRCTAISETWIILVLHRCYTVFLPIDAIAWVYYRRLVRQKRPVIC
jgi:hypothetical protein